MSESSRTTQNEVIYSSEFITVDVASENVILELIDCPNFFVENYPKKTQSINPSKIQKFKRFLSATLSKTDNITFFLPENFDILDLVVIFDDILIDEELQR